jgi:hypothetical protein
MTRYFLVLAVLMAGVLSSCGPEGAEPNTTNVAGLPTGWAIAADRLQGPNHRVSAEQRRMELVSQTRMPGWWVKTEGDQSLVLFGRYDKPQDRQARADLGKLRQMQAAGRITARTLMLTPIAANPQAEVQAGQHDLRKAMGVYTLQMAVYDEKFGPEFRKAAEQAAATLRRDGEQAWYYHGPNRSMVTIGSFGENAVSVNAGGMVVYSMEVQQLRQRFPYNLLNGQTIRVKRPGDAEFHEQPSHLVRIPGSGSFEGW